MATGDLIDFLRPTAFSPQGGPYPQSILKPGGDIFGLPLRKIDTDSWITIFRIPVNGTPLSTGLTFGVMLVDSTLDPDAGKVVRVGITVKKLVSGTDTIDDGVAASAEVLTSVTMSGTAYVEGTTDVAIAAAGLDSAAAGAYMLLKIRRVGSDAADTHRGTVVLAGISIKDT